MNKIFVIPDIHCRSFYKPILDIKETPIVFLGDYMDPYRYEGTCDEDGITNLEEIIYFAKNNSNVTLLIGNHDESYIWSFLGFERTRLKFYNELHTLYRENIELFKPLLKVKNMLFTHAGISNGWVNYIKYRLKKNFNQEDIIEYIENEFKVALTEEYSRGNFKNPYLPSSIFSIGYTRGGEEPYGGPFWNDIACEFHKPKGWTLNQIFSHTQLIPTGSIAKIDNGCCIDSRAIFEYYPEIDLIKPSEINNEQVKKEIEDSAWKGKYFGSDKKY